MNANEKINNYFNSLEQKGRITTEQKIEYCQEIFKDAERIYNESESPFQDSETVIIKAFQLWKERHLQAINENQKADFNTLRSYIEEGFSLYAFHFYTDKDGKERSGFCNIHKYGDNQDHARITTLEQLQSFLSAGIENFKFYPSEKNYLCLDIDRGHKDGIDGLKMFYGFLKTIKADSKELFKDIENGSFPTAVATPSGGFHLYFKTDFLPKDNKYLSGICKCVEIKSGNLNLTAAGSVKHGKLYTLSGTLHGAPHLPLYFLDHIKAKPHTPPQPKYNSFPPRQKGNYTLEQLAEYGVKTAEDYGNTTPHGYTLHIGARMVRAGIDKAEIIKFLKSYPKTAEHDQIETTIKGLTGIKK